MRQPTYPALDAALLQWVRAVRSCDRRTEPVTVDMLKRRATDRAAGMGLAIFWASVGYVCHWIRLNGVWTISLSGMA